MSPDVLFGRLASCPERQTQDKRREKAGRIRGEIVCGHKHWARTCDVILLSQTIDVKWMLSGELQRGLVSIRVCYVATSTGLLLLILLTTSTGPAAIATHNRIFMVICLFLTAKEKNGMVCCCGLTTFALSGSPPGSRFPQEGENNYLKVKRLKYKTIPSPRHCYPLCQSSLITIDSEILKMMTVPLYVELG